jgi:hypothetical protein
LLHRTASAALLVAALAVSLSAQSVHGAVRDSASHQPIPGAVVTLLDSSGTMLTRNITDEAGAYRLALAGPVSGARLARSARDDSRSRGHPGWKTGRDPHSHHGRAVKPSAAAVFYGDRVKFA